MNGITYALLYALDALSVILTELNATFYSRVSLPAIDNQKNTSLHIRFGINKCG